MCFSEAKSVLVTSLIFHQRTASWSVPEGETSMWWPKCKTSSALQGEKESIVNSSLDLTSNL